MKTLVREILTEEQWAEYECRQQRGHGSGKERDPTRK
jgi:hypothetical protein